MKSCKNCKKDFEPKSTKAVFCSTNCRVAFNRNKKQEGIVTELIETGIVMPIVTNDLKEIKVTLEEVCTPEELRDSPNMCESKREQKENIYRLENNKLSELKKKLISIPGWRESQGENPKEAPTLG